MAWAGLQPNDRSIEAAFKLNWATSTKEMAEAAKLADGLVASVVFTTVRYIGVSNAGG